MTENSPHAGRQSTGEDPTVQKSDHRKRYGGKRLWCTVVLAAIAGCAWLWRGTILRAAAELLIVDQPSSRCEWVLIVQGNGRGVGRYDEAARLYHEDPSRRVVLIQRFPRPTIRIGAVPAPDAIGRRELAARGVPMKSVTLIPGEADDEWTAAHALQSWLRDRPDGRLLVLCNRFQSGHQRLVLDTVLDPAAAARVSVRGLADRRYDETDWWQSRRGVKELMFAYLELAHARWCGESHAARQAWNPDDYERMLQRTVEEAR